jgi:hypothetical protein
MRKNTFSHTQKIGCQHKDFKFKIKVVLITIDSWQKFKPLAALVQKVEKQQYGLLHTAIQIGNILFHWVNDGLVHITPIKSKRCVLYIDVKDIDLPYNDDRVNLLVDLIDTYNGDYQYNSRNKNCQHFVDDALDILYKGCSKNTLKWPKSIQNYLDDVYRNGCSTQSVIDPFTKKKITFKTHSQLDTYVNTLIKKYEGRKQVLSTKMPGLFYLLKAFDRAHWVAVSFLFTKRNKIKT